MSDTPEILELIKKAQLENDVVAKNKLLSKYYEDGCKWAKGKMKRLIYTDMINPSNDEIASMVYQSFEKSINTIKTNGESTISFKSYFYWMIQYQIYSEMKTTLNYKIIPNYRQVVNNMLQEMKESAGEEMQHLNKVMIDHSLWEIIGFLEDKNSEYAQIMLLKSKGYKLREICKELNISSMALKSRIQYIKKLVRERFGHPLNVF